MEVGILVDDLGFSQESFMLLNSIAEISKDIKHQTVIFQKENVPPILNPMCAVLNVSEIFSFRGLLIVTNLENLRLAKSVAKQCSILYYPIDLDWLRRYKDFIGNFNLLKDINIVTQNKYHNIAIQKYCNRIPMFNVSNFNIKNIVSLYENKNV